MRNMIYRTVLGFVIVFGVLLTGCTSVQVEQEDTVEYDSVEAQTEEQQSEISHYTLVAAEPADGQDFKLAAQALDERLSILGYQGYRISSGSEGITLEIYEEDSSKIQWLCRKGELCFREGYEISEDGLPTGRTENVILTGADVEAAYVLYGADSGMYIVSLELTVSAADIFAEATDRLTGDRISIWLDDICITAPSVQEKITGGVANISSPEFSELSAAQELADTINSGSLPFALKIK